MSGRKKIKKQSLNSIKSIDAYQKISFQLLKKLTPEKAPLPREQPIEQLSNAVDLDLIDWDSEEEDFEIRQTPTKRSKPLSPHQLAESLASGMDPLDLP